MRQADAMHPDFFVQLYSAIRESFDPTSLKHLLSSRFDLALTDITSESDAFPEQVYEVVEHFRQRDELALLLAALKEERPAVEGFADLHDRYMDLRYMRSQAPRPAPLLPERDGADSIIQTVRRLERQVDDLESEVFGNERGAHKGLVHGVEALRSLTNELRSELTDYVYRYQVMKYATIAVAVLALLSFIVLFTVIFIQGALS